MLGAAIVKDLQVLLRDRGALASLFALPIIFVAVFGTMFGSGQEGPTARYLPVHYHAASERDAGFVLALSGSGFFRPELADSPEAVRAMVADKRADVGLIIPAAFDPAAGVPAELVIDEAASPQFRGPLEGAIRGILTAAYLGGNASIQVVESRSPPGLKKPLPRPGGFQTSVPGNAMLFGFFLALTVALSFIEERRCGTWRRLLAMPVSRPAILLAKLVPYSMVGVLQMTFLFGTGAWVFGMRVAGSAAALIVLTLAVVACATALGLFLASFGGTEKQMGAIGSISLLIMGLLGGAMVPRPIMPATLQTIGLFVPHSWALDGYHDLLLREGAGFAEVWPEIAAVLGFAAAFAALGASRFRFER